MRTTGIVVLLQSAQNVVSLVNLSVNKSADMSTSQYSDKWLADEAVDGDVSQDVQDNSCAVTEYGYIPEAWWRVDLGDVYVINSVRIYSRKKTPSVAFRLSGFSLYVSSTSNWQNGVSCHIDNNGQQGKPYPSDVHTVPCNATGRYVTLYKERKGTCSSPHQPQYCVQLELCEVQVLGCENGTYGASCENNCSGNCLNGETCNKAHGGCNNGCAAGYYGFRCDQVNHPCSYGANCEQGCSQYCSTPGQRYSTNGTCYRGCQPGWIDDTCNQICSSGFFGLECSSQCGDTCFNSSCNNVDGSCHHGCIAGWKRAHCNETCDDGKFGLGCSKKCNENCIDGLCDNIYRTCRFGCKDGWTGDLCNEGCRRGFYGPNCSIACLECSESCHHRTGECLVVGCRRGFYGPNCSIACLECSESCHHRTGECLVVGRDMSSSVNNSYTVLIILAVTHVLTIIALVAAVLLLCRRNRHSKNSLQTQQGSSNRARLPANRSGRETTYQPGTGIRGIENNENRTYEGLQMNITDTNTYEMLQRERNATYTNTQLN